MFKKIEDLISLGFNIQFNRQVNQLAIVLEYTDTNTKSYKKESWLPMSDHFYEKKVIDCINYMEDELLSEIKRDKTEEIKQHMQNISKKSFDVPEDMIEDYTSKGPWNINGETYNYIDSFRVDGDGEWKAVIVQRESDNKYFKFEWGYYRDNYSYEPEWNEVVKSTTKKTKWI